MKTSIRNVALFAVIAGFGSLLSLPLLAQLSQNSSFVGSLLNAPALLKKLKKTGELMLRPITLRISMLRLV